MRKLLHMTVKPADMSDEQYLNGMTMLAKAIGGELVKFGDKSYCIIGGHKAEIEYKKLTARLKEPA
jgi:hypothetical protein